MKQPGQNTPEPQHGDDRGIDQGRFQDSLKNPLSETGYLLKAAYTNASEALFKGLFDKTTFFKNLLENDRMGPAGVQQPWTEEETDQFGGRGVYGTRGFFTKSARGAIMGDSLMNRIFCGFRRGQFGIHNEGDTRVLGDLEVDFSTLMHGRLTVEEAVQFAKTLLVMGESVFEGKVVFEDEAHISGAHLKINDKSADEFVKEVVGRGMRTSDGKPLVRIPGMGTVPSDPASKISTGAKSIKDKVRSAARRSLQDLVAGGRASDKAEVTSTLGDVV